MILTKLSRKIEIEIIFNKAPNFLLNRFSPAELGDLVKVL